MTKRKDIFSKENESCKKEKLNSNDTLKTSFEMIGNHFHKLLLVKLL